MPCRLGCGAVGKSEYTHSLNRYHLKKLFKIMEQHKKNNFKFYKSPANPQTK